MWRVRKGEEERGGLDPRTGEWRQTAFDLHDLRQIFEPLCLISTKAFIAGKLMMRNDRFQRGTMYQKSTELLILKLPLKRPVHEIAQDFKIIEWSQ
ncbi:histone H3-like 2 [Camellia lanceoleosa]|uniref:Histone H3-like 2 n=1 Tax=Camellia lanceoleosa TaxID=1840588 RepID=A0ACC0GKI2_9ERIC|nr:histone H3-like 2 [Camellia lanceoleosa]